MEIQPVEDSVNKPKLPQTDSIQELAEFWDSHDLTDFDDQLEEVKEPVSKNRAMIQVALQSDELEAVTEIAKAKGIKSAELIRGWILERIESS